jgi:hypothetical protein
MKLILAIIIAASLALFFITTTTQPYDPAGNVSKLFLFISLLGLLLGLCCLPWLKGSFTEKWSDALKYGLLLTFASFDIGYLVFSLSTLI